MKDKLVVGDGGSSVAAAIDLGSGCGTAARVARARLYGDSVFSIEAERVDYDVYGVSASRRREDGRATGQGLFFRGAAHDDIIRNDRAFASRLGG